MLTARGEAAATASPLVTGRTQGSGYLGADVRPIRAAFQAKPELGVALGNRAVDWDLPRAPLQRLVNLTKHY